MLPQNETWTRWTAPVALIALAIIALNTTQWEKPDIPLLPWKDQARKIDRREAVTIRINPSFSDDQGWTFSIPARP